MRLILASFEKKPDIGSDWEPKRGSRAQFGPGLDGPEVPACWGGSVQKRFAGWMMAGAGENGYPGTSFERKEILRARCAEVFNEKEIYGDQNTA